MTRTPRLTAVIAALALALTACGGNGNSTTAACDEKNTRYCEAAKGELLEVTLADLRPTQPSLGYDEVYYRLGRYTLGSDAADQLLKQWCATNGQGGLKEAKPAATLADPASFSCELALGAETDESTAAMKTAVIGPGGQPYLTDGHHTLTSFWEAPAGGPDTSVRLKIVDNLKDLAPEAFWRQMQDKGWTWLRDADGKPINPEQLPATLGLKNFANDRYRGVLFFLRDISYFQDDNIPAFQEFYWGQWLRNQTDPGLRPENFDLDNADSYQKLIGNIGRAMVALPDSLEIDNGRTAKELGKLQSFDQQTFDSLTAPLDSAKPGKLAYSIAYKAGR